MTVRRKLLNNWVWQKVNIRIVPQYQRSYQNSMIISRNYWIIEFDTKEKTCVMPQHGQSYHKCMVVIRRLLNNCVWYKVNTCIKRKTTTIASKMHICYENSIQQLSLLPSESMQHGTILKTTLKTNIYYYQSIQQLSSMLNHYLQCATVQDYIRNKYFLKRVHSNV